MNDYNDPDGFPESEHEWEEEAAGSHAQGKGYFDIGECLSDGWNNTIQNLGPVVGVLFLGWLLMMGSYFTCIGIFLLGPAFIWGITLFLLNTHDGRCDANDLFAGFRQYGKVIGRSLGLFLMLMLLGILGSSVQYLGMFMESEGLMLVGIIVNLAWSFGVMVRLYWAMFFLVDQDLDAVSSLKASWAATSGNWFRLVLLGLLSGLINLAGILALIVGIFVSIPVTYLMFTSSYRQAVGGPAPGR